MPVITTLTKRPNMYPRVFIAYGPGLVLREDAHWWNWRRWNGVAFRLRDRVVWVQARSNRAGQ